METNQKEDMEWILIENEAPPINKHVLVFRKRGEIEILYRLDEHYPDDPEICNQYVWSEQGIVNDITHWMPLPSPPKE